MFGRRRGHGGGSTGLGEATFTRRVRVQAGRRHGVPVSAVPGAPDLGVQTPADRRHTSPATRKQVPGDLARSADVVDWYCCQL
jgi:hypothetical protein